MSTKTSDKTIPVDPEPFTIAAFIFGALGTVSSIAGLILQQRHQTRCTEQNTEEKQYQLEALFSQFETRLSMIDSQIDYAENLLKHNVNEEDMSVKRFGFSQVELSLKIQDLDTLYRIEANLCDSARELIDFEIAILKELSDFQIKLNRETIRRSERFRARLTRLTGGALSFKGGMKEIKKSFHEGKEFISHLKLLTKHQDDFD
jgi:hypothetical protein